MPHLVETYSRTTGLRISSPVLYDSFYPLPFDEGYVVFVTSTGMPAKSYDYFGDILSLLRPILKSAGLKTVQCGTKDDERIGCDADICGRTTIQQFIYIVKNAKLVVCGDTSALHIAGTFNVPFVSLFSITDPRISGAYFGDKENQKYITPENFKPTFNPSETPKSINTIAPEQVCNEVAKFLNVGGTEQKTIYIGDFYKIKALEIIPNSVLPPQVYSDAMLGIRYDYGGDEQNVIRQISVRRCTLVTNKPMNIQWLSSVRNNIEKVCVEINPQFDLSFIKALADSGIPYMLVSYMSAEEYANMKMDLLDFPLVSLKPRFSKEKIKGNNAINSRSFFKTHKMLLSNGNSYLTLAHERAGIKVQNSSNEGNVIDSQEFWDDGEFFYIYNK